MILNSYAQLNAKLRWVLFFLLLLAITFCFLSLSCHANKLVLKQNMKDIHSIQNHINTIAFIIAIWAFTYINQFISKCFSYLLPSIRYDLKAPIEGCWWAGFWAMPPNQFGCSPSFLLMGWWSRFLIYMTCINFLFKPIFQQMATYYRYMVFSKRFDS